MALYICVMHLLVGFIRTFHAVFTVLGRSLGGNVHRNFGRDCFLFCEPFMGFHFLLFWLIFLEHLEVTSVRWRFDLL